MIGLILLVLFISLGKTRAQNDDLPGEKVTTLFSTMNGLHFHPKPLNIKFSNVIYDQLIRKIDPGGLILTQEEIVGIAFYKDSLCSSNEKLLTAFVDLLSNVYARQLVTAKNLIDTCCRVGFNFHVPDSMLFQDDQTRTLPNNVLELQERWRKYLKYEILDGLVMSQPDSVLSNISAVDSLLDRDDAITMKIQQREKRRIQFLEGYEGGVPGFILESFLQTITSCYDPHSVYFTKHDKEDFESSLSKENYAFGFSLDQNLKKEVIIKEIAPSSPAWLSKELEEGDVLVNVKMGDQELELAFSDMEEVDRLFAISKENKVELAVKKPDGEVRNIILFKGKLDTRESMSYSCMLNGTRKVGYISFSQFYTEFGPMGINGCSTDFLRDLVKLEEDGMEGLVLDLRNNPGGSEYEAMKIAGYLLGSGELAIRVNKDGTQAVIENQEAEKWFSGPVVVLVNGGSASASELLAAALQDYNRAVVLGTNTFGKASAQNVLPVGRKLSLSYKLSNRNSNEYGFVKITTAKLNRISGDSYQNAGITPDVWVPDGYSSFISTEKDMPFALPKDTIIPEFSFNPLTALPIDSLRKLSLERQSKSSVIQELVVLEQRFLHYKKQKSLSLMLQDFVEMSLIRNKLANQYKEKQQMDDQPYQMVNSNYDLEKYADDIVWQKVDKRFKNFLSKDATVCEGYRVVEDLLK
ncbi:carboxy terminal-processing peptidase [Prolixibacteraceae bacterium Z1-6]|uniref:Carboxy terminal-processing peptidase n=1 Tax=Draconibacterium aestuarii TaxID=2998507 RepID=A0A9X3J6W7_9BACT|nr:carboxy terminal-processing peptidase [Prolixibacteraceae bacterium Z1-6]